MELKQLNEYSERIAKSLYRKYKHILFMEQDDVQQQCCVHILERFNPNLSYKFCYRECKSRIIDSIRVLRYMSKDNVYSFSELTVSNRDDKLIRFQTYYNKLSEDDKIVLKACINGLTISKAETKMSQSMRYKRYNELKDEIKWILA